jgi:hypothetical protein
MLSGKNSSLSEGMDLIMGALLRLDLEVVLQFPKKKKKNPTESIASAGMDSEGGSSMLF